MGSMDWRVHLVVPARSRCGYPRIMKCDVDIRRDLYAKVVAMFPGIGEQMLKECNVSHAQDFLFSVTVSVEVSLGTKLAQLRGSVGTYMDLTRSHSCTFFPLSQSCCVHLIILPTHSRWPRLR